MKSWYDKAVKRIESFRSLKEGWLNGDGSVISTDSIEAALFLLTQNPTINGHDPSVFPLEEGLVGFEWSFDDWEVTTEIHKTRMDVHAFNVKTDKEVIKTYLEDSLKGVNNWDRLIVESVK